MAISPVAVPPRYGELVEPKTFPIAILSLAVAAGAVVLFAFNPAEHGFYPFCMFYRCTGLLCPGCGSLRSAHELLHGHMAAALHLNILFVLMLPVASWFAAHSLIAKFSKRPFQLRIQPGWCWVGMIVLIIFGVLRNFPFAHACWLAP